MTVEVVVQALGGVPTGGVVGDNLIKNSATDYDYSWTRPQDGLSAGQIMFAGSQPQTGYLRCDGAVYLRTSYPALADAIGAPTMSSQDTVSTTGVRGTYPLRSANDILFAQLTHTPSSTITSGALSTSANGTSFTSRSGWSLGASTTDARVTVAYGASIYVSIVGMFENTPTIATSPDLAGWTDRSLTGSPTTYEIAYGGTGNVFILVGTMHVVGGGTDACGVPFETHSYPMYLATSTNGTTWTDRSASFTEAEGTIQSVAAISNLVLTVASNGSIKSSVDGLTYTARTFTGTGTPSRASAIGTTIYVTTTTGLVYSTTNGIAYTFLGSCGIPSAKILNNGSGMYVATSGTASSFTYDFTTWISLPSAVSTVANGKFWGRKGADVIFYVDNNAYSAATEFPVPVLKVEPASALIGAYGVIYGWIKT